jgi:hypothetical protein
MQCRTLQLLFYRLMYEQLQRRFIFFLSVKWSVSGINPVQRDTELRTFILEADHKSWSDLKRLQPHTDTYSIRRQ